MTPQELVLQIVEHHRSGLSRRAIAHALRISGLTVQRRLRAYRDVPKCSPPACARSPLPTTDMVLAHPVSGPRKGAA